MKRLLFIPVLLLIVTITKAQEISRKEADAFINVLNKNVPDTTRINALLKLADFNISKVGQHKPDLDSAETYIKQASQLNIAQRSVEAEGTILLLKAYLSRKRGVNSKMSFALAVQLLENSKDKFHLAIADFELAKTYNSKDAKERMLKMQLQTKAISLLQRSWPIEQKNFFLKEAMYAYDNNDYEDVNWSAGFVSQMGLIISQVKDKQSELEYLNDLAQVHFLQGNPALAEKELLRLIRDFRIYKNIDFTSVYEVLSSVYKSSKNWDGYIVMKKKFLAIYVSQNRRSLASACLREIAKAHLHQGKTLLAEKELIDLLKTYIGKDHRLPSLTYSWLIVACQRNRNYKDALHYAFLALNTPTSTADSAHFDGLYSALANTYFDLDMKVESMEALRLLRDFYLNRGFKDSLYFPVRQIGSLYVLEGKPLEGLHYIVDHEKKYPPNLPFAKKLVALGKAQCYEALKQNGEAERYIRQGIKFYRSQKNELPSDGNFNTDYLIGSYYARTKQFAKSKIFLHAALKEQDRENTSTSVRQINTYLFQIASAAGNNVTAMRYLQRSQRLKDSTFKIAMNKEIQKLSIAYGTEQKKKDIKILQDKDKLQKAQLHYAEKTRNWIVAVSGLLFLLLGVSYKMYRSKRQSNSQLQEQREEIVEINKNLNSLLFEKDILIKQKDRLINEKEWLLKEVNHRVKNNLHTVICLLESQAAYLEDDALKAIESSQHRIYAMSLIHQKLYQTNDAKTIDMSIYIPDLIQYLNESFATQRNVHFRLAIEPILLGVSQAVPLALIINEAVTNSIKYAFKSDIKAVITISMKQFDEEITLIIADNGIGIDTLIADKPLNTLGLKLIKGLSEDLSAHIEFKNEKGTKIKIEFHIDPLNLDIGILNSSTNTVGV